ncbi:hypothetical protein EV424DRAFT_1347037 [Suillus variegatus]|nr:hypothetical protein EV424DRAFT_1347037 [Suillus variegatus]
MPDPTCSPFALSLRKQSSQYHRTISKYLNWVIELNMLKDYGEVYDTFLSLPVSPSGPWTKGHRVREYRHAWWTDLATIKLDQRFLTTYPDGHEVKECVTAHFAQLFEGDTLVTLATPVARHPWQWPNAPCTRHRQP